jgi:hypothetical protein
MRPVIQVSEVHYPESDGKPMGETDEHRDAMIRHIQILQDYYRGQRVYVSGDLLVGQSAQVRGARRLRGEGDFAQAPRGVQDLDRAQVAGRGDRDHLAQNETQGHR